MEIRDLIQWKFVFFYFSHELSRINHELSRISIYESIRVLIQWQFVIFFFYTNYQELDTKSKISYAECGAFRRSQLSRIIIYGKLTLLNLRFRGLIQ